MDVFFIQDLRLHGKHGVAEHERMEGQEFLIDIRADVEARHTQAAAKADRLEHTIDYIMFANIAREVFAGEPRYLIETLAEDIASQALEDERVQSVSVTIRKPDIIKDAVPGITITRTRA